MNLYKGGLATYLDVLIAQVSTLDARIQQAEIQTRYLQAQVGLIRACGGDGTPPACPRPTSCFRWTRYSIPVCITHAPQVTCHRPTAMALTRTTT